MDDLFQYDREIGVFPLCGVDEAGRGPLAGDVYAAAVILKPGIIIEGLNDSKKLSEKKREQLFNEICEKAEAYCVAAATVEEIDRLNILQATFLAMRRAVEGLSVTPKLVLVDGNRNPELSVHSRLVVKGDATSACIAAASILAKVSRDRYMKKLAEEYPQYGFEKHKGYGSKLHYQMLDEHGISPVHRRTFLKKYVSGEESPAQKRGRLGEEAVCGWLLSEGCSIAARNYSAPPYGEIDIIAEKDGITAFVEVKARKEGARVSGAAAVTPSKQKKLILAALQYADAHPCGRCRFDVAEVDLTDGKTPRITALRYYPNAFTADEEE